MKKKKQRFIHRTAAAVLSAFLVVGTKTPMLVTVMAQELPEETYELADAPETQAIPEEDVETFDVQKLPEEDPKTPDILQVQDTPKKNDPLSDVPEENPTPKTAMKASAGIAASAETSTKGSGIDWTLDDNGVLAITSDTGLSEAISAMNADSSKKAAVTALELSGITRIPDYSFRSYSGLIRVSIPETVTSIGSQAFMACTNLKSVSISQGVQTIREQAFKDCFELENVTIPQSVQTIGQYAFNNCHKITEVQIPSGLSDSSYDNPCIPEGIFAGCDSLTHVTIPEGIVTIKQFAFDSCTNLTNVEIPSSATSIGNYAFQTCTNLTYVTIPENVTEIGHQAFNNCTSLNNVTMKSQTPPRLGNSVFDSCPLGSGGIYVPAGKAADYMNAATWTAWKNYIRDPGELIATAKEHVNAALGDISVTNDTTQEMILEAAQKALADAGISTVSVEVNDFKKEPSAADTEGRVTCTVTLSYGSTSDSILFDRTIECPVKVEKDENAPDIQFAVSDTELAQIILLDKDQKKKFEAGQLKIVLAVKSGEESVPSKDKTCVEEFVKNEAGVAQKNIGQYLDISLSTIEGNTETAIPKTTEKLKITITISDSLKNTDSSKKRTFSVLRVHDGSAEILNDQDQSEDSITIATDRFSTYAIVYQDTSTGSTSGSGNGSSSNSGDNNGNDSNDNNDNSGNDSNDSNDNSGNDNNDNNDDSGNDNNNNSSDSEINGNDKNESHNEVNENNASSVQSSTTKNKQDYKSPKTGDAPSLFLYFILLLTVCLVCLYQYYPKRLKIEESCEMQFIKRADSTHPEQMKDYKLTAYSADCREKVRKNKKNIT